MINGGADVENSSTSPNNDIQDALCDACLKQINAQGKNRTGIRTGIYLSEVSRKIMLL